MCKVLASARPAVEVGAAIAYLPKVCAVDHYRLFTAPVYMLISTQVASGYTTVKPCGIHSVAELSILFMTCTSHSKLERWRAHRMGVSSEPI